MAQPLTSVWPPLPPTAHLRRASTRLPFPLEEPGCRLYSRARDGLAAGLRALGVGPGSRVLVPAWHHGSEVQAVRTVGATCVFYAVGPDLAPDPAELEALLDKHHDVAALHLTHYLGFPQDAARWRGWCDRHGLLLVEDAAQAWLATLDGVRTGSVGDLSVWCLYKTYGLPDGAAVVGAPTTHGLPVAVGSVPLARRHASWLAQTTGRPRSRRHRAAYDADADFATGVLAAASGATRRLLPRVVRQDAAGPRRAHYSCLLEIAGHVVPRPFDVLPAGAVPFVFPVAVRDKAAVLAAFADEGCRALDLWSVPHGDLPVAEHQHAAWLRRHVVGLPVHQGLSVRAAQRIGDAAARVLGGQERIEP